MSNIQSMGFPNLQPSQPSSAAPQPTKPRTWFTGFVLLSVVCYGVYLVWDNYFRNAAYGVVNAKMVDVAAPYNGVIVAIQVNEGNQVKQGQVLATIENIDVKHQYEAARESLALNSSQLTAQLAKLKLEYAFKLDSNIGTLVNYYELVALVAQQEANTNQSKDLYARGEKLLRSNAIPVQDVNILKFSMVGHQSSLKELKDGMQTAKKRVESLEKIYDQKVVMDNWQEQLKPLVLKIEQSAAEMERLKTKIELGKIVAPVSGVIAKRYHFAGEQCDPKVVLFSIVEDDSHHVVLYVQQEAVHDFNIGQHVGLTSPLGSIQCVVERFGDNYEPAPDSIKRYYRASQNLLPIYMKIDDGVKLRYGATVKLPYLGK